MINELNDQMTLLLILFPMLLLTVGCGVDSVEESDANILEPTSADFHFQDFPLAGGSLIPLEEIPVVSIEKTREDDEFFYWQLKADPVPIHEDLVVGVSLREYHPPDLVRRDVFEIEDYEPEELEVEVRLEDGSIDKIHVFPDDFIHTHLRNEGYFQGTSEIGRAVVVIVIPKLQNTSQEFKLPISFGFKENKTLVVRLVPRSLEGRLIFERITGTVTEDVSMDIRHSLRIMDSGGTSEYIVHIARVLNEQAIALMDMPIFQTFEGYILREGFAFSYYQLGEAHQLDLQR